MSLHEIVVPVTEPATEWVRGRALQKHRPGRGEAALKGQLAIALIGWAVRGGHGRVAVDWRFRVAPAAKVVRPLVPDVAYLSYHALGRGAPDEEVDTPLGAPTVAFQIVSESDLRADVDDRTATYLDAGGAAVGVVDRRRETVVVHDGYGERAFRATDSFAHPALPGFSLALEPLFARARR
jgi:hypothetical protein